MFKNHFKVAVRYLARHKAYTAINILGLAVGITSCVLIMLFVRSEWSFDHFNSKSDRIYRAYLHEHYGPQEDFVNTVTPIPLGPTLQNNYSEVESTCRIYNFNTLVKKGQVSFEESIDMVDPTLFSIFDFHLINGNPSNPFPNENSIILTEPIAKKYFGNENPIGKTLEVQIGDNKILFTVCGISANCPEASTIQYNILLPYSSAHYQFRPRAFTAWQNVSTETYVLLKPGTNISTLTPKFQDIAKQALGNDYKPNEYMVNLQPLTDIHLDTSLPAGNQPISNPVYSYVLSIIGILILLLACINFVTLTIGRATTRALEVGVRKVLGAHRKQLIRQFWTEALLIAMVALVIGLGMTMILINPFDTLINRQLSISFDPVFILYCIGLLIIIGLIAGIYPALVLSGFQPIEALKGKLKSGSRLSFFRRSLIVGQFVASIAMIICTIIVSQQLKYIKTKDLGYNKGQLVVVQTNKKLKIGMPLATLYKNELMKESKIDNASVSLFSFSETPWVMLGYTDDHKNYRQFELNAVDPDFVKTMGIQIVAGRDFLPGSSADDFGGMLVNEALVKEYGWTDPIGKKLPGHFDEQVVGVMKDFNYESLHTPVKPVVFVIRPDTILNRAENILFQYPPQPRITVRIKSGDLVQNIAAIKKDWQAIAPDQDFDYKFLDQTVAQEYEDEQRANSIIDIASVLSIFIACIGLFGIITLIVTQRTKEIGIRKVLGANVGRIAVLLSKDFAVLILIAAIIAFPVSWWAMNKWLENFAYKVNIEWWVFIAATFIALIIALVTVSLQTIKAGLANPVKSLRTE
jgi:putative ABC transport system permease protein